MSVSVVVPTYNRQNVILRAVKSALGQTHRCLEVIVVDDHSEDDTREILKSVEDSRVRYVLNRRSKGAQGARNTGIEMAQGEWVAFLDSDDRWNERKIERQLEYASTKEETVHSIYSEFERTKNGKVFWRSEIGEGRVKNEKKFLYSNPLGGFTMFMAKKNIIKKVGGLDESLGSFQDRDIYYRVADRFNIYNVPKYLARVSETGSNRISEKDEQRLVSAKKLYKKYGNNFSRTSIRVKYCMRADIAQYAALSGNFDTLAKNLLYVFLSIFVCVEKAGEFVKAILLKIRVVEKIRVRFAELWIK
ncbi:glycosyltransferase family 2 protein [Salinibacter sp.]|jgi:glycosyltransferase involved in cell wall biosynthesis|uniref:glycosyltransferase family 2 protein n=1 Tax=Salinibacter sp. TaxID=2065818 RepID=UPI0021E8A896|nr:glycosyltransferase family 2 protein [Salinibacter sp.]